MERRAGSGLRGAIELLPGSPVPGEQFVEPGLRRVRDAAEDIGEPGLRIDVVELGGADQRIDRRRAGAAAVRAGEQPRLPAQGDRAFILPISGGIASSTTAGTHFLGGKSALKPSNSVPTAPLPPLR